MIGIMGKAALTTDFGTEYSTFHYKIPRIIKYVAYFILGIHILLGYLHKRFSKPEGEDIDYLGYSSLLVWRILPTWQYDKNYAYLRCRYCFEHKTTLEKWKSIGSPTIEEL